MVSACQNTGLYLANLANDDARYQRQSDLAYGEQPWQTLDLYSPHDISGAAPAIVFYYGGSWSKGRKEDYAFIANRFTRAGYHVIIPDYVKFPQAKYPAFVEDAAQVSAWIDAQAERYRIDRKAVHLMGHSAGAHIGIMLLVDPSYLAAHGLTPDFYRSFVGLAGPYDFTPGSERYKKIFGPPERYKLMQATRYIDGSEPPMLLLTAGLDWLVADSNTYKVKGAAIAKGGNVTTHHYPWLGHLTIVGSFSDSVPFGASVAEDILAFYRQLD